MGYGKRIAAAVLTLALMLCLCGGVRVLAAEEAATRSGGVQSGSGDIDVPFDPSKTVRRIFVSTQPTKKEYLKGEALDLTGLVLKATYSDNSTAIIKNYTVSGYSANTLGAQSVKLTVGSKSTTFQVTVFTPGDANGDGAADGRDATLLLQYAAGWDVQIKSRPADANGDGTVDGRDATLLLQHAAGWNVKLGK